MWRLHLRQPNNIMSWQPHLHQQGCQQHLGCKLHFASPEVETQRGGQRQKRNLVRIEPAKTQDKNINPSLISSLFKLFIC